MSVISGYAGRTELPDNLKSMFRPISMVVPDSAMIAEIILFGEGFNNTKVLPENGILNDSKPAPSLQRLQHLQRVQSTVQDPSLLAQMLLTLKFVFFLLPTFKVLAKKVHTLYSLAVQQLSKQDHYDFGLRALTSVLRYAGRKKRGNPDMADEEVIHRYLSSFQLEQRKIMKNLSISFEKRNLPL